MTEIPIHDVFISHAFEDKNAFANELAMELRKAGLKVWYSGFDLKLGDSIAESVNRALKGAAFGIVVISPVYLQKQWAMNELNALFAQEQGQNRILPILHNITINDIKEHFPILADRYTVSSDAGMDFILKKVLQAMNGVRKDRDKIIITPKNEKIPERKNNSENKMPPGVNTNINQNSNRVIVKTGNSKTIILIILIIATLALYFLYENSELSTPPVNKDHITPSNSN